MEILETRVSKNKNVVIILAFFLGGIGVHRFYLGHIGRGILYLLFFWTMIPAIIGFIDFIIFAVMSEEDFNRKYNPHLIGLNKDIFRKETHKIYGQQQKPEQTYSNTIDYEYIMREASRLKNEITGKIKSSSQLDAMIVRDIKPLVDKYIHQIKEVIEREKYIARLLNETSSTGIERQINIFKQKATETDNPKVKYEYQNSVSKLENQLKAIKELEEEREILKLRLESTIMTLDQIKFDLLRIENLASEEQRKEFNVMFEEKSKDLSLYYDELKKTYDNVNMN